MADDAEAFPSAFPQISAGLSRPSLVMARAQLASPARREPVWRLLAASALAACAALGLAASVILGASAPEPQKAGPIMTARPPARS